MRYRNNFNKTILVLILFCVIIGILYFFSKYNKGNIQSFEDKISKKSAKVTIDSKPKSRVVNVKKSVLLNVPYTVQAPFAKWTVHEESCEEAAMLMYHYFLSGKKSFSGSSVIPPYLADSEFRKMKNWQVKKYGKEPDLSIEQLGAFMKSYYGYNYKVYKKITVEDIKRELSGGRPVMVPVITHGLQNPHYGPNPTYHILLIKGYDSRGAITNDAGIKEGQSTVYSWKVVFSAIDAQTPKMGQGREMVVVMK